MRCPVDLVGITQDFKKGSHYGIDFGWFQQDVNQPIYSADDGEVIYNRKQTKGGYTIVIKHDSGYCTVYAHLLEDSQLVHEKDKVKKGQQIAKMGNSGHSTGTHLHFGIYKGTKATFDGKYYVDPKKYINIYDGQTLSSGTAKKYNLYATKTAVDIPDEPLNVRNKSNTSGKIVGEIYNGQEVESYGKTLNGWNIVDNIRGYYCSNKYLKED